MSWETPLRAAVARQDRRPLKMKHGECREGRQGCCAQSGQNLGCVQPQTHLLQKFNLVIFLSAHRPTFG
jgi:hypothetical protein